MIRYLSVEQVVSLHQRVVGHLTDVGVRDFRALENAVEPAGGDVRDRGSLPDARCEGGRAAPRADHDRSFTDAARETALLAAECFLVANGATLHATDRDLERLGAAVASGEMSVDALAIWIRQRTGRCADCGLGIMRP